MKLYRVFTIRINEGCMPTDLEEAINNHITQLEAEHQCSFELHTMFSTLVGVGWMDLVAIFVGERE